MRQLEGMNIKIFADGADVNGIRAMYAKSWIKGFTTNPTLMRKAGIADYKAFALEVLTVVPDRPVSFEVFADEFEEMERQAMEIASWGRNVNVKIPVSNTKRRFSGPLIRRLSSAGVKLNITAVMTLEQVRDIVDCLRGDAHAIISVFAGRIADTLLNIVQANEVGCHIITATNDILNKLHLLGKDHGEYSLETVEMFYKDATAAGYTIPYQDRPVAT